MTGPLFDLIGAMLLSIPAIIAFVVAYRTRGGGNPDTPTVSEVSFVFGVAFMAAWLVSSYATWAVYAQSLGGFPK